MQRNLRQDAKKNNADIRNEKGNATAESEKLE